MWKIKKNGFFAKIGWHYLCQEGRKKRAIFVHTICFGQKIFLGPKQCKPGKTIKIVVSAEIAQKQKWHLFLEKGVFDMGEKVGFTNCVFEKLCFPENTIFIVFSAKHSISKTKTVCWKKTENLWQIVGCFWTWQMVSFGFGFFWGFNIKKVCFWCVWHCFKSVKNACFAQFWGLFWGGLLLFIWVWKVRCFCVSCVCFSLLCCFCFCFVCFVIGFVFCFVFCFVF